MLHYRLNTGSIEHEPPSSTSDEVLRMLMPMYYPGSHPLPVDGYRAEVIEVGAGCFCLVIDEVSELPLLSVAVAEDSLVADELWYELIRFCEAIQRCGGLAPFPTASLIQPVSDPWYATIDFFPDPKEADLLSDFSRHFAWGWVDSQRWRTVWCDRQRFW